MVKVGKVELTDTEANELYFSGKRYIVAYRTVYVLEWCANYVNPDGTYGGIYGRELYYHRGEMPLTKRGRWFAHTAAEVNKLNGGYIQYPHSVNCADKQHQNKCMSLQW